MRSHQSDEDRCQLNTKRPSIRVRITIRPDDFGLLGLYLHLSQISSDLGRATALRGVLSLGIACPSPTELPENIDRLPAIAVRLTIIARDLGLKNLHDELLLLPTDLHRRIHLKDKITKIQIGANESKSAKGIQMVKINRYSSVDSSQSMPAHQEFDATQSPALQSDEFSNFSAEEPISESAPLTTQTPTSNQEFKRRMRDASRAFDI